MPPNWSVFEWKSAGSRNGHRERIWFSPQLPVLIVGRPLSCTARLPLRLNVSRIRRVVMGQQRQRGSKHDYPESAHVIRDYATLKLIAQAFAAGQIKLLILLGGPGKGKGQIVKRAMQAQAPTTDAEFFQALSQSLDNILARLAPDAAPQPDPPNLGPGLYIKGFVSPISFHIAAYKHRDAPICIDDADAFFADAQLRERTKHLSETDKYKLQAHRTLSKELIAEGVPQEFWTTSPGVHHP